MRKYQAYFIVEIWDGHESREDAGLFRQTPSTRPWIILRNIMATS